MNAAARAAAGCLSPAVARKRAARRAGLRRYESELRTRRGHCLAPGCASRQGVVRVTIDVTARDRINRFAGVECAQCGRFWYRIGDNAPVRRKGYQAVLITLIAPSGDRRVIWQSHGAVKTAGHDSVVIVDARLGQLDDAVRQWQASRDKREAAKSARKAVKLAADAAATRKSREVLAAMDAARAARAAAIAADESAAAERERNGLA